MERRTENRAQDGAYQTEHWLAWGTALVALVLGALGLLRGFGMLGGDGAPAVGAPVTQAASYGALLDSMVWFLPAIALGLLSMALHNNDHHRMRDPERAPDADEGLWKGEHAAAYLMALATIVTAVLTILVGFDVLGRGNDQPDSIPWGMAAILSGIVTTTLHAVRGHQLATEEDYIVRMVERRAAMPGGTTTTAVRPEPGTETRR